MKSQFPALLERLEKREGLSGVPGLFLPCGSPPGPRQFEKDLDRLSLPDTRFLPNYAPATTNSGFPVQTRRGCPMNCSYCSTASIEGCALRKRSPHAVVQWIARCLEQGFRRYYFVDNTFNRPPSYAKGLCEALGAADMDITWRCIYLSRED